MKIETVALANLSPPPHNMRKHPEVQIKELIRAVEKFGQTRPIIIDERSAILAGNGLVEALRRMGWEKARAFRMSGLSAADKTKLILSDNKIFELGLDDYEAVREMLRTLPDYDVPGFDTTLLERLNSANGDLADTYVNNFGRVSDAEVSSANGRAIAEGSTAEYPHDNGSGDGEAEIIACPHCGGTIRLARRA